MQEVLDFGTRWTAEEWNNEALNLFGSDHGNWTFMCPVCRQVQSIKDFTDLDLPYNYAYSECLGRHSLGGGRAFAGPLLEEGQRCDYVAWGRFKTGYTVHHEGIVTLVFPFAVPVGEPLPKIETLEPEESKGKSCTCHEKSPEESEPSESC